MGDPVYGAPPMAGSDKDKKQRTSRSISLNKKARHQFEILDTFEAGIVLVGTEVKTLRVGQVSLEEAWGKIEGDEVFLVGAHIQEYEFGNRQNHLPTRRRKLLLHRREIRRLKGKVAQKGLTMIPIELFFNERGIAKLRLGVGRGKKLHDKRQDERTKVARRDMREAEGR